MDYDPDPNIEAAKTASGFAAGSHTSEVQPCRITIPEGKGIRIMTNLHNDLPGGSTPAQYALPPGASELQDLIEHRDMNFAIGNIFKAAFRLGHCDHSDPARDLRKIIFFAKRELERITKQSEENR